MIMDRYSFTLLMEKEIYSGLDRDELFFAMFDFTEKKVFSVLTTPGELESRLVGDNYYVAHNIVSHKGKKPIFRGELVVTSRAALICFLKKTIEISELRDLLISPVFIETPTYVISIYEDVFYLYV